MHYQLAFVPKPTYRFSVLQNVTGVIESFKIMTEEKCTLIAKYAFDFAVKHARKKVTAVHKANIM